MTRRNFALTLAVAVAVLVMPVNAFFGGSVTDPSASASARVGTSPFERLAEAELTSVATGQPTLLTSQWRNNEILPWQNERCVVEFLRHFGWVFCWERAVELKRDALPALKENGVRLIVVGIGSVESGQTFSERTGLPMDMLLVDESEETEAYKSIGTRNSQRDPSNNKQIFEGVESMWSSKTTDAIEARGRDDLNTITGNLFKPGIYKPMMPSTVEATLVQGASFVFKGKEVLLEHYDASSGAHVSVDELLEAALSK